MKLAKATVAYKSWTISLKEESALKSFHKFLSSKDMESESTNIVYKRFVGLVLRDK